MRQNLGADWSYYTRSGWFDVDLEAKRSIQ